MRAPLGPVFFILMQFLEKFDRIIALADLRGELGTRSPSQPNFFHFHEILGKNLAKNRFSPQCQGLAPPIWEILDPPLDLFNIDFTSQHANFKIAMSYFSFMFIF